ncbi:beta-xylosidase [Saccharopolyspora phatthalungensis]|uniref:Beta-xylosidase n=1 Tax=Saccharopolyspora phatthalungensis TaxID=664693 RepID=A0A840QGJ7_9PSEU|nr:family 43 glycosylhydrolase [Saccharopolyspora phatthalungensis]MBB5159606.1 beta-xylosidase [Saccharopolyspora phatthalungensis]
MSLIAGAAPAIDAAGPGTYSNPVSAGAIDTFPDPSVIRGKDGLWYAYGTQSKVPQSQGKDGQRILPILRSRDMINWQYAGQVFTPKTRPAWQGGSGLWAPDIRYVNGLYHLYYSVPGRQTVGLATSPTPTGPWADDGAVLPRPTGCPTSNIDQSLFTDTDGTRWLYWGSYDTVCVARMNADATRTVGEARQIAQGRRMEGGFVVKRGGYYYLFYSDGGCCDGAYSGYQVKVGRSASPTGPFVDDEGVDLRSPTSKGGIVVGANGNKWIGPGHNALQTDLAGQDWLVYHSVPADDRDPRSAGDGAIKATRRPMLIDRLDWIDGWPVVRAGAGPSDGPQPAPVTSPSAGSNFNGGSLKGMRADGAEPAGWALERATDAGGYANHTGGQAGAYLVTDADVPADVRAEADLRVASGAGAAGLTVAYRNQNNHIVAWLDRGRHALVTEVVGGHGGGDQVTPLPADFRFDTWHNVAVELRGGHMTVEVSEDRLRDPAAVQERDVPSTATHSGAVGVAARGNGVSADNLSAAPLYQPVTQRLPQAEPGKLLRAYSDEFNGMALPGTTPGSPWRWVRGPAAGATMTGGALSLPTQNAALAGGDKGVPVLLRDAPPGDFTVETKIQFAPDQVGQQAGILLYDNDDRYFKLVHSVLPLARADGTPLQVSEFNKVGERPATAPARPIVTGPMFGGPTADTMWLRMTEHTDTEDGKTEVRAATSRDGSHWVQTGVWTLPTRDAFKIGLVSMGGAGATARFDYLRVSGPGNVPFWALPPLW